MVTEPKTIQNHAYKASSYWFLFLSWQWMVTSLRNYQKKIGWKLERYKQKKVDRMLSFADDVPLLVYNSYVLSFYYFLKKVSSNEPILVMFSLVCFSYNAVLHKGRKMPI